MKDRFNRFAVRYLTALLLGLLALLAHGFARTPVLGALIPGCASAWELSKLAYWPLLAGAVLAGRMSGGAGAALKAALPSLTLTAPALFLACWAASAAEPAPGVYLLMWVIAAAIGAALAERPCRGGVWLVLAAALGAAYVLFTYLPPGWGPFLDPRDAAAMATIPW